MVKAPKLTTSGIELIRLDAALYQRILNFYRNTPPQSEELNPYLSTNNEHLHPVQLRVLPRGLSLNIHKVVQPNAEAWVGRRIIPTYVYGIRTYLRGAILKEHRDRDGTHIVSAIINVDQQVDEPWPLYVEEESPRTGWRKVYLNPGDLLLYESNRLEHGRMEPLVGDHYDNIFVHFSL